MEYLENGGSVSVGGSMVNRGVGVIVSADLRQHGSEGKAVISVYEVMRDVLDLR